MMINEQNTNKTEVSFPSSDPSCQIYGDLALPNETTALLPAIVFVNGSGPIDRNGDVPSLHMILNTSNQFSEHITSSSRPAADNRAIAVLTYDKRGVGKSVSVPHDKKFHDRAGLMDIANDAMEAVRFVAGHPRIDKSKIVLLGHSEGAIIMPLICSQVKNNNLDPIFGCIFYSGFGENIVDAMKLQRETLVEEVGEVTGLKGWLLRMLITEDRLEKKQKDMLPTKWLQDHFAYDAHKALVNSISCHCLAITGVKDLQVRNEFCNPNTAAKLVPNAKSMEAHRLPNLTHTLRSMEGEVSIMNMQKDYAMMGMMPLDPDLLKITDAWCDRILFDGNEENVQAQ